LIEDPYAKTARLFTANVKPFWQRSGIATVVCAKIEEDLKKMGYALIEKSTNSFVSPAGQAFLKSRNKK